MTSSGPPLRVVKGPEPASAADGSDALPDPEVSRALHGLIDRFDAFLRRAASRHGLRGSELDDVVQDVRVRIWKSFGTAESIRRANPTYMYRAAVSAALDIVRRRRALKATAMSMESFRDRPLTDARARADDRVAEDDVARVVHESLGVLQESRRGVVRMYLAGYDRFEIAELMGWTEGKTRNLLYRGLEDLRGILASRGITRDTQP